MTEVEHDARRRLEESCRLLVKFKRAIRDPQASLREREGFIEGWCEMEKSLELLEVGRSR